jgi:hypothetical protein
VVLQQLEIQRLKSSDRSVVTQSRI